MSHEDDIETAVRDPGAARPRTPTARGVAPGQRPPVELATPTEITAAPAAEPLRVISLKTPAELAAEKAAPAVVVPRVHLRPLSDVTPIPGADLGRLAPPRDPREARARRLRDAVIWGSAVIIVGCVVMLAVWFLARG